MTPRKRAQRLREHLKKSETKKRVWEDYKNNVTARSTSVSQQTAEEVLRTIRTYEEYMKLMEAELKAKVKFWRGKFVRLQRRYKEDLRKARDEILKLRELNMRDRARFGSQVGENIPIVEATIEKERKYRKFNDAWRKRRHETMVETEEITEKYNQTFQLPCVYL